MILEGKSSAATTKLHFFVLIIPHFKKEERFSSHHELIHSWNHEHNFE